MKQKQLVTAPPTAGETQKTSKKRSYFVPHFHIRQTSSNSNMTETKMANMIMFDAWFLRSLFKGIVSDSNNIFL